MSKDWAPQFCPSKYMSDSAGPLPMTSTWGANGLSGQVCCCASKEKQKKRKNMSDHLSIINSALSYLLSVLS
jgi:hypothetical protein